MNKLIAKVGIGVAAASVFAATLVPASALASTDGSGGTDGNTCVIRGNGAFSWNRCKITEVNIKAAKQINKAAIFNGVTVVAATGGNDANFNTGGDVKVKSGDANVTVTIKNKVNQSNTVN